ncbi:MAG: flavodoxin family protein [Candidatus Methanomethylophilaceae archaeon]|jgi:multimeric flavodoxin WrbA
MKVVAFNCSPRKDGNTAHMIKAVLDVLQSEGIITEFVQVGGNDIHGCRACGACKKNKNMKCVMDDDIVNECAKKMAEADGIIIGSPTYFADLTPEAKALIDRCGYVLRGNGNPLRRKVAASVCAVRRAGSIHVLDSINHFFTINEMVVVSSSYWNMSTSRDIGDFEKDEEGVRTMNALGKNMAWALKKLNS